MESSVYKDPNTAIEKILASSALAAAAAPVVQDGEYNIRLPNFEGPLDLLLHLIEKEQIDIYDIPIAKICLSYLEHLELMQDFDISVAGEFMVMAATLMQIKSRMLLPPEPGDLENADPRLPLVAQLLEYERFKRAAQELDKRPWLERELFIRPPSLIQSLIPKEALLEGPIEPIDTYQMLLCLKIALNRTNRPPIDIETDSISIKEKVKEITQLLMNSETLDFSILIPAIHTRLDIVVSFLAVLELARLRFISIIQHETFAPIHIRTIQTLEGIDMGLLEQF